MSACPYCQFALPAKALRCPQCQTELRPDDNNAPAVGTQLQSVAALRKSLGYGDGSDAPPRTPTRAEATPAKSAPAQRTPTRSEGAMGSGIGRAGKPEVDVNEPARRFRPVLRPPMAVVTILDDDQENGEEIRVRGDRLVIGRTEGDLRIPHDTQISSLHLELRRMEREGAFRWFARDLGSTNGTFARASEALLKQGQEFLLGSRRYRFELSTGPAEKLARPTPAGTQLFGGSSPRLAVAGGGGAALVECRPEGDGVRHTLTSDDLLIGADGNQCALVLAGDEYLAPCHVRIWRDARKRWLIKPQSSQGGLWLRVQCVDITGGGLLQIGEQRIVVRVP